MVDFYFFQVRPDYDMEIMTDNQTLETLSSQILQKARRYLFRQQKPNLVIVQGDTTTAMMAALSAFYQRIPVAHVEAEVLQLDIKYYAPFPGRDKTDGQLAR